MNIKKFLKVFSAIFFGTLLILGIIAGIFLGLYHFFGDIGIGIAFVIYMVGGISAYVAVSVSGE